MLPVPQASFRVPASHLAYKGFSGEEVVAAVVEAYHFAHDDPFRAATANKVGASAHVLGTHAAAKPGAALSGFAVGR